MTSPDTKPQPNPPQQPTEPRKDSAWPNIVFPGPIQKDTRGARPSEPDGSTKVTLDEIRPGA